MKNPKVILALAALAISLAACTTTKVAETPPGSGNYSTNVIVDPRLTGALETAKAVNDATAPVNPFSGLIDIGLGAIALGASWFAKKKNDELAGKAQLLKVVVQGVENSGNAEVKAAIQTHAVNLGVEGALGTTVAKINSGQL